MAIPGCPNCNVFRCENCPLQKLKVVVGGYSSKERRFQANIIRGNQTAQNTSRSEDGTTTRDRNTAKVKEIQEAVKHHDIEIEAEACDDKPAIASGDNRTIQRSTSDSISGEKEDDPWGFTGLSSKKKKKKGLLAKPEFPPEPEPESKPILEPEAVPEPEPEPEEKDHAALYHSDSDPEASESMFSDNESIFSDIESNSSKSSVQGNELEALREFITALFTNDEDLEHAFTLGLQQGGMEAEAMTTLFARALRLMGKALRNDATAIEQKYGAKRVRADSNYIAYSLRKRSDPEFAARRLNIDKPPMSAHDQEQHLLSMVQRMRSSHGGTSGRSRDEADMEDDSDISDSEEVDTDADLKLLLQKKREMEEFIMKSNHMTAFKESLRTLHLVETGIITQPVRVYVSNQKEDDPQKVVQQNASEEDQPDSPQASREDCTETHMGETHESLHEWLETSHSLPEIIDRWSPQWFDFLWEPPVSPGASRVRWTCVRTDGILMA